MTSISFVLILAFAIGYLLGSIPFGLVLTKIAGTDDIRSIGSGNIGATNVLRTGRKGLAAATLIGDMLKGTVAVLIGFAVAGREPALAAAAGAFVGHLFPVWLGFKGGKGIATYIGVLLGFAWPAAALFGAIWLAVAAITRYSSLSSLLGCVSAPIYFWLTGDSLAALVFLALSVLSFIMHRGNIQRLVQGTEGKIGQKSAPNSAA